MGRPDRSPQWKEGVLQSVWGVDGEEIPEKELEREETREGGAEVEGSPLRWGPPRGRTRTDKGQPSCGLELRLSVLGQLLLGRHIPAGSAHRHGPLCPHGDPGHPEGPSDL